MKVKSNRFYKSILFSLAAVLFSFTLFNAVSFPFSAKAVGDVYDTEFESPTYAKFNSIGVGTYLQGLTVSYSTDFPGYASILDSAFNNLRTICLAQIPSASYFTIRLNLSDSTGRLGYILVSLPYVPNDNDDRFITLYINDESYNFLTMHNYNAQIISTSSYTFPSLSTQPNPSSPSNFPYIDSIYIHDLLNQYPSINVTPSSEYYKSVLFSLNLLIPLYGYDTSYDVGYSNGYNSNSGGGGITEEERLEIYQTGYDDGYDDGYDVGLAEGDEAGYDRGFAEGDEVGYDRGYDEGFQEAESYIDEARQQAYDEGYGDGVSDTILDTSNFSWYGLFTAVIDVPVRVFSSLFDFEVFGINLAGFFVSVLSIAVIVIILKKIL